MIQGHHILHYIILIARREIFAPAQRCERYFIVEDINLL